MPLKLNDLVDIVKNCDFELLYEKRVVMNTSVILILGIAILLIIIVLLKSRVKKEVKSKYQKRAELIDMYKNKLELELAPLKGDLEAIKVKKVKLLKNFSSELSQNIFFESDEIKEIIRELSRHDI